MSDSAEQVQTASADLAAWLRQQLDADTRRATELKSWAQGADFGVFIGDPIIGPFGGQSPIRNWGTGNDITHLADPTRVLRAVEAKRRVLAAYDNALTARKHAVGDIGHLMEGAANTLEHVLRMLATEYADRPGYREEWRP